MIRNVLGEWIIERSTSERLLIAPIWQGRIARCADHARHAGLEADGDRQGAHIGRVKEFHHRLCDDDETVLDPACGTGNFLYVDA